MTYTVEVESKAAKALSSLDRGTARRIVTKIQALAVDPRPAGATKLTGGDSWRIRVGDYRVVYVIDDTIRVVNVTRVAHRREVYRGM